MRRAVTRHTISVRTVVMRSMMKAVAELMPAVASSRRKGDDRTAKGNTGQVKKVRRRLDGGGIGIGSDVEQ